MEPDKKPEENQPDSAVPAGAEATPPPADALANPDAAPGQNSSPIAPDSDKNPTDTDNKPAKKPSALKQLLKHFNVYFLLFVLLILVGGAIIFVSYLNGKKTTPTPSISNQTLTQSELKQLANSNATVGGSGQTISIQGDSVFSGQVLMRSNLEVAGTLQLGGNLNIAQLNVSGSSNLSDTQTNTLQVSGTSTFQGLATIQNGMDVGGSSSINAVTIGTLTATKISLSDNAQLQIPNHISFNGSAAPHVSSQSGLGGGSTSISGSDTSGTINVSTGSNPQAGCMANVTFSQAFYSTKPNVIISVVSSNPINLEYYAGNLSATGFSICSANTPPANQQFGFSYFITASSTQ